MTAELLARVEYANLLSINWNEQKIQTNFRLIVDALNQEQAGGSELRRQVQRLKEEVGKLTERMDCLPQRQFEAGSQAQSNGNSNATNPSLEQQNGASNLLNEFQKKLSDNHNGLTEELKRLRKELDDLRRQLKDSMEHDSFKLASDKVSTNAPSERQTGGDVDGHKQCMAKAQAGRKFDSIYDLIEKLRADNLSINAKLNVQQQQTLDNHRKSISQANMQSAQPIKPSIRQSTTNLAGNNPGSLNRLEPEVAARRDSIKPKIKTNPSSKDISNQQNNIHAENTEQFVPLAAYQQDRDNFDNQIGNILIDLSTLKLCYDELKLIQVELKKSEERQDQSLEQLANRQESMRQRMDIERDRVDRELKSIKLSMTQFAAPEKEHETKDKKEVIPVVATPTETDPTNTQETEGKPTTSTNLTKEKEKRDSESNRIGAKLAMLQSLVVEAVNKGDLDRLKEQLHEQLKSMKASTDKRLAELANKIHTTDTTIDELDERLKSELSGLQNSIQEHRDATKLKFGETDKRHGAMISRCDDLKKDIQYVKEDLEYYKNNLTKADTGNSNSIYVKSEEEGGKGDKSTLDAMRKRIEEMKRQYTNKLHDLRTELINAIRDFERRMSNKGNSQQQFGVFQDKLEELKLYLSRKADVEDTKKSLIYLDKKLSVLMNSLSRDDESVEDARAAKKNWFCLSCDKVLEGYSGKVGKHIPWDALSPKQTGKAQHLQNMSKIEEKKRKDPLPTLSYSIKK